MYTANYFPLCPLLLPPFITNYAPSYTLISPLCLPLDKIPWPLFRRVIKPSSCVWPSGDWTTMSWHQSPRLAAPRQPSSLSICKKTPPSCVLAHWSSSFQPTLKNLSFIEKLHRNTDEVQFDKRRNIRYPVSIKSSCPWYLFLRYGIKLSGFFFLCLEESSFVHTGWLFV